MSHTCSQKTFMFADFLSMAFATQLAIVTLLAARGHASTMPGLWVAWWAIWQVTVTTCPPSHGCRDPLAYLRPTIENETIIYISIFFPRSPLTAQRLSTEPSSAPSSVPAPAQASPQVGSSASPSPEARCPPACPQGRGSGPASGCPLCFPSSLLTPGQVSLLLSL